MLLLAAFGLHLYWTEWALSLSLTSASSPVTLAICSFLLSSFLPQQPVSILDDGVEGEGYKAAHFRLEIHFPPATISDSDSSHRGLANAPSSSNFSAKRSYHHTLGTSFSSRSSSRQFQITFLPPAHLPHKSPTSTSRFQFFAIGFSRSSFRGHLSQSYSFKPTPFPLLESRSRKSTCSFI